LPPRRHLAARPESASYTDKNFDALRARLIARAKRVVRLDDTDLAPATTAAPGRSSMLAQRAVRAARHHERDRLRSTRARLPLFRPQRSAERDGHDGRSTRPW
jgi:hypothetical protein